MQLPVSAYVGLLVTCGVTAAGLAVYRDYAKKNGLFDIPNSRSMHVNRKLVVGAGSIILSVQTSAWALALRPYGIIYLVPVILTLGLTFISFRDDIEPLSPALRFFVHLASAIVLSILFPITLFAQWGIPVFLGVALVAVGVTWFVNLYNFMDGIDGITGVETVSVTLGFLFIIHQAGIETPLAAPALWLAGGAAIFLLWNWQPARMLIGDSGSIPIGFLIAWLMIELARNGQVAAAFILPLYYLFDATLTLFYRIGKREEFWRPHRQHAYQRAVLSGASHQRVVCSIAALNAVLVGLAIASVHAPVISSLAAFLTTALFWGLLPKCA